MFFLLFAMQHRMGHPAMIMNWSTIARAVRSKQIETYNRGSGGGFHVTVFFLQGSHGRGLRIWVFESKNDLINGISFRVIFHANHFGGYAGGKWRVWVFFALSKKRGWQLMWQLTDIVGYILIKVLIIYRHMTSAKWRRKHVDNSESVIEA